MIKDLPSSEDSSINLPQSNMTQSPFRMIVLGEIPSVKIDENDDGLAVLEINPISKGHTIIIPKVQAFDSDNIPKPVYDLANEISSRIKSKLKYKEVDNKNIFFSCRSTSAKSRYLQNINADKLQDSYGKNNKKQTDNCRSNNFFSFTDFFLIAS